MTCIDSKQCCGPQQTQRNCAGPLELTGEDNIGSRKCCGNLKKCVGVNGLKSWCSSNGKCEDTSSCIPSQSFAQYLAPYQNIKENFSTHGYPPKPPTGIYIGVL